MFSVIIPTCHRNDLLALCLDRLAPGAQTLPFDQYEVIVTDDGSQTTAEQLIRQQYPWVRWTQGPRRGPAANRNHGASLARGEWLAFTDDDCVPDTDWLEGYRTSASALLLRAFEGAVYPLGDMSHELAGCPINLSGGCFWTANICIRRDLFSQVKGFDERFAWWCEDQDMFARLRALCTVGFAALARVGHPVRLLGPSDRLRRLAQNAEAIALYYALNDYRLGILRHSTLIRWLYKPRLVAFVQHLVRRRTRRAYVELVWMVNGNLQILRHYRRIKHELELQVADR